jgi:hypothetical protein
MTPEVRMMTPLSPAFKDRVVSFKANRIKRQEVPDTFALDRSAGCTS